MNAGMRVFVATLFVVFGTGLLVAGQASAAEPQLEGTFGCSEVRPCDTDSSFTPGRLAVDESSGDIWVIDTENAVVDHFGADGTYLGQVSGADTTAAEPFAFAGDSDIAVDNSGGPDDGDVYLVTEGGECASRCGVFAFSPDGAFLWEKPLSGDPCGVAVDASGGLWTSDYMSGIQERSTEAGQEGEPLGSPVSAVASSCEIDFDAAGNLYVREWGQDPVWRVSSPSYESAALLGPTGEIDVAIDRANASLFAPSKGDGEIVGTSAGGSAIVGTPFNSGAPAREYAGVTVDASRGRIYVADRGTGNVEVFALARHHLSVSVAGSLPVRISADAGAIAGCSAIGGVCAADYEADEVITLTATIPPTSTVDWSGCLIAHGRQCIVVMEADTAASATVAPERRALQISETGSGSGTVTCDGDPCASSYLPGEVLTLAALPAAGSSFAGWSGGGCSGTGECRVILSRDTALTAAFEVTKTTVSAAATPPASIAGSGPVSTIAPKAPGCKRGFRRRRIDGHQKCVAAKKHKRSHHRKGHRARHGGTR